MFPRLTINTNIESIISLSSKLGFDVPKTPRPLFSDFIKIDPPNKLERQVTINKLESMDWLMRHPEDLEQAISWAFAKQRIRKRIYIEAPD